MLSIIGMTFALFTSSVQVRTHLVAGTLDVTLKRTNLSYNYLDTNGKLVEKTDTNEIDFSAANAPDNIFGITGTEEITIVPGSFFEAELKVTSDSSCAYDYSVTIVLVGTEDKDDKFSVAVNDLAKQVKVTVIPPDVSKTKSMMLSELLTPDAAGNGSIDVAQMQPGASEQSFIVRLEFVDDVTLPSGSTNNFENNDAQGLGVFFDVIVTATQATDPDPVPPTNPTN